MKLEDFISSMEKHENLDCEGLSLGEQPEEDFLVIKNGAAGCRYKVLVTTVQEQPWPVLEAVFRGEREPIIMEHMSRIVGYYSKVKNWNKSKLGELRDRKAGDYSLGDMRTAGRPSPPPDSKKSAAETRRHREKTTGT
jgi:hypothetical protein